MLLSYGRCHHGARCSPSSNFLDFACTCGLGYTGRLCDEDVDECVVSSPCRNGATCRNTNGSYHCVCAKGYEGRDCVINTDDCASCKYLPLCRSHSCSFCAYSRTVSLGAGRVTEDRCARLSSVVLTRGLTPLLRYRNYDRIFVSVPCQNGGTCLDGIGDYTCLCVDGFGGKHCEIDVDECVSAPCHNGATCNQYVNSYTCTCPLGFSGINCQTNDEDCTESSCMNGGKCVDGINNYTCICQPGLVSCSPYREYAAFCFCNSAYI